MCKFYQGAEDKALEDKLKQMFETVHREKPDASRKVRLFYIYMFSFFRFLSLSCESMFVCFVFVWSGSSLIHMGLGIARVVLCGTKEDRQRDVGGYRERVREGCFGGEPGRHVKTIL